MTDVAATASQTASDLVDAKGACAILGGSESPIDVSSLYRGIQRGWYPPPLKIGRSKSRWLRSELLAVLDRAAAARKGVAA